MRSSEFVIDDESLRDHRERAGLPNVLNAKLNEYATILVLYVLEAHYVLHI